MHWVEAQYKNLHQNSTLMHWFQAQDKSLHQNSILMQNSHFFFPELRSRQKPTNKQTSKQNKNKTKQKEKQRVCHTVALPFKLKVYILRQKKNYGNSNISPCKNIIFKQIL
jgi:hypothetical protein